MRYPSELTKIRLNRGTGSDATYNPYTHARDFNSLGTCVNTVDWKTGRTTELLSQGEGAYWYTLRYDDNILDIKEQFPLVLNQTTAIAKTLHIKHPKDTSTRMTTDFLILFTDGHYEAHSFKSSKQELNNARTTEKLYIEKMYWEKQGIPFKLIFKDQINMIYSENIRFCSYFSNYDNVFDEISFLKYLIINKMIDIDLEHEKINMTKLLTQYQKEVNQLWKKKMTLFPTYNIASEKL